jgi:plastocyanin
MRVHNTGLLTCFTLALFACGGGTTKTDMMTAEQDMKMPDTGDMKMPDPVDMKMDVDMMVGPRTHMVNVGMGGNNFNPATLTIKKGDTVQWNWIAGNHNVVSGGPNAPTPDGKFCNDNNMNCAMAPLRTAGAPAYKFTFNTAGTFPYFCRPHFGAGMKGTITVE